MDRDKWTTHANFAQMCEHIYDLMVEAGVAKLLETAVWNDASGVAKRTHLDVWLHTI